jgi:hypothetical protein
MNTAISEDLAGGRQKALDQVLQMYNQKARYSVQK